MKNKLLLFIFVFLFSAYASAQNNIIKFLLDLSNYRESTDSVFFEKDSIKQNGLIYKEFYASKQPRFRLEYITKLNKKHKLDTIAQGVSKEWYENGQLKYVQHFSNNKMDGNIQSYWENGHLKRDDEFSKDSLIKGICYDSLGNTIEHFPITEIAEFRGGVKAMSKFLENNIHYPIKAQEYGIQGRVIVQFVVAKDGVLENIKVLRSVDPYLDKEAIRVIMSMPKWTPGKIEGNPATVKFVIPVIFRLK